MNNGKISQKQGIAMIAMLIMGESMLMVMGLEAKTDIWISILLAGGFGALIMIIYAKLMSYLPEKDFYETLEFFIGKAGSKIVIFLFTWYFFHTCALVLRNYGQFVVTIGLKETPLIAALIILIILCAMAVRAGIEVLGRWTVPFLYCVIAFLLITVLLVSQNMNITNLLPLFDRGVVPIAKGTLGVVSFPFAEIIVFLFVFPAFKKGISIKKVLLKGLAVGGTVILVTSLTDMLVLGPNIAESLYYPTFSTMATINYGDFLHRLEVVAAIVFILAVFVKITIYLFAVCKGTTRLLGLKNHRFIVIPISLLVVNMAYSFDSMIYFHEWVFKVWPYYAPFFQIVIPIILLIIIETKKRKLNVQVKS